MGAYPKPEPRPKKQPQPIRKVSLKRQAEIDSGLFQLKVGKPLKRISQKQAKHEREKSEVYRKRSEGERPFCQGCGRFDVPLSNSHRIGQANKTHVANPENLDTLCIGEDSCHTKYETGRVYLLKNGDSILSWLATTDWQRYAAKCYQILDRINDDNLSLEDLPTWVEFHVLNVIK